MRLQLTHIGVCVPDLAAARRFYTEGLGFVEVSSLQVSDEPAASLLQLPGVDLEAVYLERDGVRVELLHYRKPGVATTETPRPMNAPGLTHLSFRVDDVDGMGQKLAALGGRVLPESRIEIAGIGVVAMFVLDPGGTRIELVRGFAEE